MYDYVVGQTFVRKEYILYILHFFIHVLQDGPKRKVLSSIKTSKDNNFFYKIFPIPPPLPLQTLQQKPNLSPAI